MCLSDNNNLSLRHIYSSSLQVVLSCVVSASLGEAQVKDASASTDQAARLAPLDPYYAPFYPRGLSGPVSSTNVNVPGKFSYVVNAVHPTKPEVRVQS